MSGVPRVGGREDRGVAAKRAADADPGGDAQRGAQEAQLHRRQRAPGPYVEQRESQHAAEQSATYLRPVAPAA